MKKEKNSDKKEDEEDRVEIKEKKEYIIYKDVIKNFWEAQSYHSQNNFDEFITKKKAIKNAMLLLPIDSKVPGEKKIIKDLLSIGENALKKQPPGFKIKYSHVDIGKEGRRFVQEISAEEMDTWSCPLEPKNINQAIINFKEEQYKICLEDLIITEFKIEKFLVKKNILKKEDKDPDELIEDFIKSEFPNLFEEIRTIQPIIKKNVKKK